MSATSLLISFLYFTGNRMVRMMRYTVVTIFSVLLVFTSSAQPTLNRDSLLKVLAGAKDDSGKAALYITLSNDFLKDDIRSAEKYALLAGDLSRRLHYKKGIYHFYDAFSNVYLRSGQFDSLLAIHKEAMAFAQKDGDSVEIGRILLNIGMAWQLKDDFELAVSNIETGRDLLIRNGVHRFDAEIYNLLQVLYNQMHQYRKAADVGFESIKILEKSGDNASLQFTHNNLALTYINRQMYDSARYFLKLANERTPSIKESLIPININLEFALIALKQQELDTLKKYVSLGLELSRNYGAKEYVGLAQFGLAYYYLQKKDYYHCRLMADSALSLAMQYNFRSVKQRIYPVLSALYYAQQDGAKGYYYSSQFELLSDSMLNESISKNTLVIEKRFETERKEAQIQLQQTQLRQKSVTSYFLLTGLVVVLIITMLGYRNYRNRQVVQQLKIEELLAEQKLAATEAVLKGEEQERTRLARDLHDGLGGMLSGIKHSLNTVKGNLVMTPDNLQAFDRSLDMLDSSIKEMRRVAHNMMPEILLRYGLDPALKEYCREITQSGVLRARYQSIGMDEISMDQTTTVTVYRIVQELVSNSIKHAAASDLLVQAHASMQEKLLVLTVEDNGRGFDTTMLHGATGIGWRNIQNRVDFLKGRLDIHSEPGKGTSVLIELKFS